MTISKIDFTVSLLIASIFLTSLALADEKMAAEEIIAKSRLAFYYAGDDMRAKVLMELINKVGQKRVRELTMLRKDYENGGSPSYAEASQGRQKYYMYFHKPADVKDTTFMVYKYPERDDDRWLFIPSLDLVKRIASNDKFSSFVGSDFSYEDISGRKPEEDSHTLLKKETINDRACLVIESLPKEASEYTKRISWIDEITFLPIKEEFYDRQNELYRTFEALEIKDIDGIQTITKRVMKNVKTGHRTEVTLQEVKYNLSIADDTFTERYLRKAPTEWIAR